MWASHPAGEVVAIGFRVIKVTILHSCILFVGISFCLAFAALSRTMFARLSLRFFLLYLFLEALNFTFEWLLVHPASPYKAMWLALMMASYFLMAPCVWLFACEIHQNKPPRIWPPAWRQTAVVALGCVLMVPLLFASHAGTLLDDPSIPRTALSQWIHITMVGAVLLFLLQVPWYLMRCLRLFRERVRINKFLFSSIDEPALNALRALMWVMVGNGVLGLARTLHVMIFDPSKYWEVFFSASEVAVTLVALYVIFKRSWQYSTDDQQLLQSVVPQVQELSPSDNKKYAKSSLDENTRKRVLNKIIVQFEAEKIYRKSSLKLQHLCDATGESAHYVSQVINQDLNMSFFDLVNHHRIEEAKVRLKQEEKASVLDIALDVGFNSKSTFNKVFKTSTGQTPTGYRAG